MRDIEDLRKWKYYVHHKWDRLLHPLRFTLNVLFAYVLVKYIHIQTLAKTEDAEDQFPFRWNGRTTVAVTSLCKEI
jgi:hypothetical protein